MSDQIEMAYDDFFGTGRPQEPFRRLLRRGLQRRGALSMRMHPDHVAMAVTGAEAAPLVFRGRWRSPGFARIPIGGTPAKVLLPFLYYITGLQLRHDAIYTLGYDYRSIADFFMRNAFHAFCRDAPVTFGALHDAADQPPEGRTRDLQLHYLYILKAVLSDAELNARPSPETLDFVLASAHCALAEFADPLLRSGAASLRAALAESRMAGRRETLLSELALARSRLMTHYT